MNIKDNLSVVIILAAIIIGGSYIFVQEKKQNYIEHQQENETLQKQAEEKNRQLLFDQCLNNAYETYSLNWEGSCQSLNRGEGCQLPTAISSRWDKAYTEDKNYCLQRYN